MSPPSYLSPRTTRRRTRTPSGSTSEILPTTTPAERAYPPAHHCSLPSPRRRAGRGAPLDTAPSGPRWRGALAKRPPQPQVVFAGHGAFITGPEETGAVSKTDLGSYPVIERDQDCDQPSASVKPFAVFCLVRGCRRRDLNPHPGLPGLGPQPSASTRFRHSDAGPSIRASQAAAQASTFHSGPSTVGLAAGPLIPARQPIVTRGRYKGSTTARSASRT